MTSSMANRKNGFKYGKQKEFPIAKSLRGQHKLIHYLSELFFVLHGLLNIYFEKDRILFFTSRFQSDPLEKRFGQYRQMSGEGF